MRVYLFILYYIAIRVVRNHCFGGMVVSSRLRATLQVKAIIALTISLQNVVRRVMGGNCGNSLRPVLNLHSAAVVAQRMCSCPFLTLFLSEKVTSLLRTRTESSYTDPFFVVWGVGHQQPALFVGLMRTSRPSSGRVLLPWRVAVTSSVSKILQTSLIHRAVFIGAG